MGAGSSKINERYLASNQTLNLSNLRLKALPKQLKGLPKEIADDIKTLDLSFNALQRLPRSVAALFPNLAHLNLQSNELATLPRELSFLGGLTHLNLSQNSFKVFPEVICSLYALRSLNLKGNKLRRISSQIHNLPRLQMLDLSGNCLVELPVELATLKELTSLPLEFNTNLTFPPQKTWHQGAQATLEWLATHQRSVESQDQAVSLSESSLDNPALTALIEADRCGSFDSLEDTDDSHLIVAET